jgi:hypothetical protein
LYRCGNFSVRPLKLVLAGPRDPTSLRGSSKIGTFSFGRVVVFFALGFTIAFFVGTAYANFAFDLAFFSTPFLASFLAFSYSFVSDVIFSSIKLLCQASRNIGQKERLVINTSPRLFVKNLLSLVEYCVNSSLK